MLVMIVQLDNTVAEWFPKTRVSGTHIAMEKWVEGDKLNNAYLHFLPNFCHIWLFYKVERTEGTIEFRKIIKNGKKLTKNEEYNSLVQLAFNLFLHAGYPKPGFRVPVPPLICAIVKEKSGKIKKIYIF